MTIVSLYDFDLTVTDKSNFCNLHLSDPLKNIIVNKWKNVLT